MREIKQQAGFTLIELMVSVSIFAIVTLITSGSFIVLANIYRKVQSNRVIVDNLNLAMDTMTLQIREGRDYNFTDCTGGNYHCIRFDEYIIENGEYTLDDTFEYYLEEDDDNRGVLYQHSTKNNETIPLTSREIDVEDLIFYEQSSDPSLVTVALKGVAINKENLQAEFLLQTTLSQRNNQAN